MDAIKSIFRFVVTCYCCLVATAVFAFDFSTLAQYQSIAVKTFTVSDSMEISKHTIQGNKDLDRLLGQTKTDYKTHYVYDGDTEQDIIGLTRWYYFFQKSWNGRGKGELKYEVNEVMKSGRAGDIVTLARKSDDEILLLIVQKGSSAEKELYTVLGIAQSEVQRKSWWQRFWSSSARTESEYDIEPSALSMPTIPEKSWARIYFTPGPDCEKNIIAAIDASDRAIDVAVYSITNDKIVERLIAAHNRGVAVRVISDRLQSSGRASLIDQIQQAGIPVVLNKKHKIMHNKFAIFDKKDIETGSYNWTSSATQSNAENCMFFPEQNKEFSNQFKYLWLTYGD